VLFIQYSRLPRSNRIEEGNWLLKGGKVYDKMKTRNMVMEGERDDHHKVIVRTKFRTASKKHTHSNSPYGIIELEKSHMYDVWKRSYLVYSVN